MYHKKQKYLVIILWGTSMYALQDFMNKPNARIQILMSIGIAFLIYTANQIFMTNKLYSNKYLRHVLPMLIMNCVLIPINVVIAIANDYKFADADIKGYLIFNVIILIIYILQHVYYKNRINRQLRAKISTLE